MKGRRRPYILARRPSYLGCEGQSERAYGERIRQLLDQHRQDVHLAVEVLRPGGGDPLALVELAVARMADHQRKRRMNYVHRAILLDTDIVGQSPDRDLLAVALAVEHGVRLVWQNPCFEGLLLRHFDVATNPRSCDDALFALRRVWPAYKKGLSARELGSRIGRTEILLCATVEDELRLFLSDVGFL